MKNSVVKKILCCALAVLAAFSMTACRKRNSGRNIDASKTQVELFNYEAGYGREWVDSLIARFEDAVKDISFEEGKKGVQVWYNGEQTTHKSTEVPSLPYHVLFCENADYYDYRRADTITSISDIITQNDLTLYDGSSLKAQLATTDYPLDASILSKMTDQQKAFYTSDGKNDYYAVPSYMSTWGIIYDIELWEKNGLYIVDAEDGDFHVQADEGGIYYDYDLTAGPNGVAGDYDDGLPRSYDEFWALCQKIHNRNIIPIGWSGKYQTGYVSSLGFNLINTCLGAEQMMLNYTFKGSAKNLIKVNSDGTFVFENGKPVLEDKNITEVKDGYEMYRSQSIYYMVDFIKNLFDPNVSYYNSTLAGNNFTHTDTQKAFIEWGYMNGRDHIAMLEDGLWWLREATPSKNKVYGDESNFLKVHKYGWMPLPYPTEEIAQAANDNGIKPVLADSLNAFGCIRKGVSPAVKDACKALLLFSCTDASCIDFTVKTGSPKGLNYDVPTSVYGDLPYFTQNFLEFLKEADKVYNFSGLDFYNSNKSTFQASSRFAATYNGTYQRSVVEGVVYNEGNINPKTYAEDIYAAGKSFFTTYSW